jgi:hypothetical protein
MYTFMCTHLYKGPWELSKEGSLGEDGKWKGAGIAVENKWRGTGRKGKKENRKAKKKKTCLCA